MDKIAYELVLTFIGISSYWQNVFKGVIIIAAVALDVRKNRKAD